MAHTWITSFCMQPYQDALELASDAVLGPVLHPHTFVKISVGKNPSFKTDGAVIDMTGSNPNSAHWISALREVRHEPVPYTHLTLPTNREGGGRDGVLAV